MGAKLTYPSVKFERSGEKIIVPEKMGLKELLIHVERQIEEEDSDISINEEIDAYPLDGIVSLMKVLKKRYGWTTLAPTPGFFGSKPPQMLNVSIGPKPSDTIQVPWGRIIIPGVTGYLNTGLGQNKSGQPIFILNGVVKRRDEKLVHEIANEIRETVLVESIYKGKAIVLNFRDNSGERIEDFRFDFCPTFLDVSHALPENLIFNDGVMAQIQTNVFNVIEHSDKCRELGVPLKRGIILEGPYGTGKTLTANVTGKKCIDNGWTFIYLKEVKDLDLAILMAKHYMPCAIFAEDIDAAFPRNDTEGRKRTSETDQIFNVLDGVETKNSEIMVILTSNDIEAFQGGFEGFLRPGRIDAVIRVELPDRATTVRLAKKYGGKLLKGTDEELGDALTNVVGKNAAVIREVIERSKLSAIGRKEKTFKILPSDIKTSSDYMTHHLSLLEEKKPIATNSPMELAGILIAQTANERIQPALNTLEVKVSDLEEAVHG